MIRRSYLIRLHDILNAIEAVAEMIEGAEFGTYRGDLKLRRAVERCVEIVSEASRHLPAEIKSQYPEQPWVEIAAIGNLLRHHYEVIDDLIMWKIASRSLPELRPAISSMIQGSQ